jgi:uncharacterized protein YggE
MLRYLCAGLFLVGLTVGCGDSATKEHTTETTTTTSGPEGSTETTETTTKQVEVETDKDNTTAEKELQKEAP